MKKLSFLIDKLVLTKNQNFVSSYLCGYELFRLSTNSVMNPRRRLALDVHAQPILAQCRFLKRYFVAIPPL
jgi:hypothetical protein